MPQINLNNYLAQSTHVTNDYMRHGVYYAHYLRNNSIQHHPTYYQTLIASAKTSIQIWDPYFFLNDASIFSYISRQVDVSILTSKTKNQGKTFISKLVTEISLNINISLKGCCDFHIGYIDRDRHGSEVWNTHDRYLIIDDRYFLVGASVASYLSPHASTGICELATTDDQIIIKDALNSCWAVCTQDGTYHIAQL